MSTASVVVVFRSAFDLHQNLGSLQITDVSRESGVDGDQGDFE